MNRDDEDDFQISILQPPRDILLKVVRESEEYKFVSYNAEVELDEKEYIESKPNKS